MVALELLSKLTDQTRFNGQADVSPSAQLCKLLLEIGRMVMFCVLCSVFVEGMHPDVYTYPKTLSNSSAIQWNTWLTKQPSQNQCIPPPRISLCLLGSYWDVQVVVFFVVFFCHC